MFGINRNHEVIHINICLIWPFDIYIKVLITCYKRYSLIKLMKCFDQRIKWKKGKIDELNGLNTLILKQVPVKTNVNYVNQNKTMKYFNNESTGFFIFK